MAEGLEPGEGLGDGVGVGIGVGVWNVLSERLCDRSCVVPAENANTPITPETTNVLIKIPNLFFIAYLFLSGSWMPRESRDTFLFEDDSDICADQALIAAFSPASPAHTHIDCERPVTVHAIASPMKVCALAKPLGQLRCRFINLLFDDSEMDGSQLAISNNRSLRFMTTNDRTI